MFLLIMQGAEGLWGSEHLLEEAMSNVINLLIDLLQSGVEIPTYEEALQKWAESLAPGHREMKWKDRPQASIPMNEELYYATLYIAFHGANVEPLRVYVRPCDTMWLPALKRWFRARFR
ncbi:MAG TPA: hypothetical protein EYP04_09940 [Anaerolineae bacterium]|nr:hypothetical protein [Anaerolineae bacterium]